MAARIGVGITADVSQLNQSLRVFVNALTRMTAATTTFANRVNTLTQTSNRNFAQFAAGVQTAANQMSASINHASVQAGDRIAHIQASTRGASDGMQELSASASAVASGFGAALGVTAVNAVQALIGKIRQLQGEILDTVSFFERLEISTEFFFGIERSRAQGVPFEEALRGVQDEAEGTLLWLRELSVFSPFTTRQIGDAFRMAAALGLGTEGASQYIPKLVDLAAAAGLNAQQFTSAAKAITDTVNRGKLAGEEIRQFANAGVPIRAILVEALDVANNEFDKLLEEGFFTLDKVLPALNERLDQFAGAAEAVTVGTIGGLVAALEDLRDIATFEFFGTILDPLKEQILDFINLISSDRVTAAVRIIGEDIGDFLSEAFARAREAVGNLVDTIASLPPEVVRAGVVFVATNTIFFSLLATVGLLVAALTALINPFTILITTVGALAVAYDSNFANIRNITKGTASVLSSVLDGIARAFVSLSDTVVDALDVVIDAMDDTASAATGWGNNIVSAFASGISGAVGIVQSAIGLLGGAISGLLAPGSPPKILPDLDEWGREAAEVYLQGWKLADFSILDDVGSNLQRVLRGLVGRGDISELDAPTLLLGGRQAIAQAIQEFRNLGHVTEGALDRVREALGPAGDVGIRLVNSFLQVSSATQEVARAQEELNRVTEFYDRLVRPLQRRLEGATEAKRRAEEEKEILHLRRTLANVAASERAKEAARTRIQEIQARRRLSDLETERDVAVDKAEDELSAAEKIQKEEKNRHDLLISRLGAQVDQLDLITKRNRIIARLEKERQRELDKLLTPLEKQLLTVRLQREELADLVKAAEARFVLDDASATAAEKAAAQIALQEIGLRKIERRQRLEEKVGIGPEILDRLGDIPIVLADIGEEIDTIEETGPLEFIAEDTQKRLDEFRETLRKTRERIDDVKLSWNTMVTDINENLPNWAKVLPSGEGDGGIPLLETLSGVLVGLSATIGSRLLFRSIGRLGLALGGALPLLSTVTTGIGLFATAWALNLFSIRDSTSRFVSGFNELLQSLRIDFLIGQLNRLVSFVRLVFGGLGDIKSLEDFRKRIGSVVQFAIDLFREWFDSLDTSSIGEIFSGLLPDIRKLGIFLAAVNLPLIVSLFRRLLGVLPRIAGAFGTALPFVLRFAGVVGLIASAIGVLVRLLRDQDFRTLIADTFQNGLEAVEKLVESARQGLPTLIRNLLAIVVNLLAENSTALLEWLGPLVSETIPRLGEWLASVIRWIIGTAIPGVIKAVFGLVPAILGWISGTNKSADVEVPSRLGKLLEALGTFFREHLGPALLEFGRLVLIDGLWAGLKDAWFEFTDDSLPDLMANLVAGVLDSVPLMLQAGVVLLHNLVQGIVSQAGKSLRDVKKATDTLIAHVLVSLVQFYDVGIRLARRVVLGMFDHVLQAFADLKQVTDQIIAHVLVALVDFYTAGIRLATRLVSGIYNHVIESFEDIQEAIQSMLEAVVGEDFLEFILGIGKDIGTSIIDGILAGINSLKDAVGNALKGVLRQGVDDGKEELEARSPSGLTAREIGVPFVEGIVQAILSGTRQAQPDIERSMQRLTDAAEQAAGSGEVRIPVSVTQADIAPVGPQGRAPATLGPEDVLAQILQPLNALVPLLDRLNATLDSYFAPQTSTMSVPGRVSNNSISSTYQLNVSSSVPSQGVVSDFAIMETLAQ